MGFIPTPTPDTSWPTTANQTGDSTTPTVRASFIRAWHGYLLATYQDNNIDSNGNGALRTHLYDPYGDGQWISGANGVSNQLENFVAWKAPAVVYSNLYAYFFFNNTTNGGPPQLSWCSAFQPSTGPDHSLQFQNPINCTAPQPIPVTSQPAGGLSAAILGYSIYLLWIDQDANLWYATSSLNNAPILSFTQVQLPLQMRGNTWVGDPPQLAIYNGVLCGFLIDQDGYFWEVQFRNDAVVSVGGPMSSSGHQVSFRSQYSPALAADPNGQFLMCVYQQIGSNQLMDAYFVNGNFNDPFILNNLTSEGPPVLVASPIDQMFLAFPGQGEGGRLYSCETTGLPTVSD